MNQTPGEILREARIKAGYRSASQFAAKFHFTDSTYRHHENGTRELPVPMAKLYAEKLKIDWQEFFKHGDAVASTSGTKQRHVDRPAGGITLDDHIELESLRWPRDFPIRGTASCGDGTLILSGEVIDRLRRPPRLAGIRDAYGLYVAGQSMYPWRKHGDPVYVHPHLDPVVGDKVVVQARNAAGEDVAYIKELVRRTTKDLRLRQYNPPEEVTLAMKDVIAVHRIMDWPELFGL